MLSSRKSNHLINKIHDESLRTVYNDTGNFYKNFQEHLQLSKGATVHHSNIQILTTEVYKIVNGICPLIMKKLFSFRKTKYNLRNFQEMKQYKNCSLWFLNS